MRGRVYTLQWLYTLAQSSLEMTSSQLERRCAEDLIYTFTIQSILFFKPIRCSTDIYIWYSKEGRKERTKEHFSKTMGGYRVDCILFFRIDYCLYLKLILKYWVRGEH